MALSNNRSGVQFTLVNVQQGILAPLPWMHCKLPALLDEAVALLGLFVLPFGLAMPINVQNVGLPHRMSDIGYVDQIELVIPILRPMEVVPACHMHGLLGNSSSRK